MRGLQQLVFSVTNRCTARCQDCPIVHEGHRQRDIAVASMMRIVDEVHSWGSLRLVIFTGGEPFLLGDSLNKIVSYVAVKGILTRIVTNAYWATSRQKAVQILTALQQSGLTEINFSCDDYHQAFVPLENIRHANEAACEIGLPALIAHRTLEGGRITVESLSEYFGVQLAAFKRGQSNPKFNVIVTGPNIPLYSGTGDRADDRGKASQNGNGWMGACDSVLRSIIVSPDLRVEVCCGIASSSIPELYVGSLAEDSLLAILQRANQDLIVNWLALEGPSSILDFVRLKDPAVDLPRNYVNRCHACHTLFTRPEIRRVLQEHAAERRTPLMLMRSTLDWITDDWAPTAADARAECAER